MNRGLRNELSLLTGLAAVGLMLAKKPSGAAVLGLLAAGVRILPSPTVPFENRSVIITGGSRGLGLALAEQFLKEGALVTLLARDPAELDRAEAILQAPDRVLAEVCDVTDPEALQRAFEEAEARFGRIDVLVNNAGTITVGPFEAMTLDDFDALMNLQQRAVVHATQLVLPAFRRMGGGSIVNISSIGGAVPVPHMTTYCAGKFATSGFSESVTPELARENIHVTTVYPAFMRTGSPIQAVFKGDHEKEFAWFTASDVAPFISVAPEKAAKRIINGVRHREKQVVFPWLTKLAILGHALLPHTYGYVMQGAARRMPQGTSQVPQTGAQSQGWLERQFWYQPLKKREDRAERRFNQREKFDAKFNLGVK